MNTIQSNREIVPLTKSENLSINNFMSRLLLFDGCRLTSSLTNMAAHVIWEIGLRALPVLEYPTVAKKIDHADLAYPNGEVVKKGSGQYHPFRCYFSNSTRYHWHGYGSGLSVKMDSAYAADIVDFEGLEGTTLKSVRQEPGGAVSIHVNIDIS